MNQATFEQLVSAWLDEPENNDLQMQIEAAVRADPQLGRVLDEWRRCDDLVTAHPPVPHDVDWAQLRERIMHSVDQSTAARQTEDESLTRLLSSLPRIEGRVDWERFRGRVATSISRGGGARAARRWRYRQAATLAAAVGLAAGLLFTFMPAAGPGAPSPGLAIFTLSRPPAGAVAQREGVARVYIAAVGVSDVEPERFFIIDPMITSAASDEAPDYY